MKTRFKHIHFVEMDVGDGSWLAKWWSCRNNKTDDILGEIDYYDLWKQWVFTPTNQDACFSHDCLTDIASFLRELNTQKGDGE